MSFNSALYFFLFSVLTIGISPIFGQRHLKFNHNTNYYWENQPKYFITEISLKQTSLIDETTLFRGRNYIIPATFISVAVATNIIPGMKRGEVFIRDYVVSKVKRKYTIDDWLRFAPLVGVFGFDLIQVKSEHKLLDKVVLAGTSALLMAGMVEGVKRTAKVMRPDNSSKNSFPSGHVATAFFGAHLLFKEYKNTSPWIGIGGYALATTTAVFRSINNRHWVSDLMAGAGIGILTVELSYLLLPTVQKWLHLPSSKEKQINDVFTESPFGFLGVEAFPYGY